MPPVAAELRLVVPASVILLSAYAAIFFWSWEGVPFITSSLTHRTSLIPARDALRKANTTRSALEALQCTDGLPYDTTTSWAPGNGSAACQCASALLSTRRRLNASEVIRCFLQYTPTDVETAYEWDTSVFVTNPAVLVGVWNSAAVMSCSGYMGQIPGMLLVVFGLGSGLSWTYPIYGTSYTWAIMVLVIGFALLVGYITMRVSGEPRKEIRSDWIFWGYYAVCMPIAVSIYNGLRLQRDLFAGLVYTSAVVGMTGGVAGCRLMYRAGGGME